MIRTLLSWLINAVIRPVLLLLTLCLLIFVINGLLSLLAAKLPDRFVVDSFMAGVIGSSARRCAS